MSNRRIPVSMVIIGIFCVIALVGGIIFFVAGQNQVSDGVASGETGGSASEVPAESAANSTDPEASICGLTAYSASNDLEVTAPETQWEWEGGLFFIVQDETYGPALIEENRLRHCYSRTPTGALHAVYNYAALGSLVAPAVMASGVIPGPLRDELLTKTTPSPIPPEKVEPVAFKLLGYNGNDVVVDIVYESEGNLVSGKTQVRWFEGDWRLVPLPDKEIIYDVHNIPSVAGYVPWGPRVGHS